MGPAFVHPYGTYRLLGPTWNPQIMGQGGIKRSIKSISKIWEVDKEKLSTVIHRNGL